MEVNQSNIEHNRFRDLISRGQYTISKNKRVLIADGEEYAFSPKGDKVYAPNGDIYSITWDYHDTDCISDTALFLSFNEKGL